jgi:hypothetical protein
LSRDVLHQWWQSDGSALDPLEVRASDASVI